MMVLAGETRETLGLERSLEKMSLDLVAVAEREKIESKGRPNGICPATN